MVQYNIYGAVLLEQVREETDRDPVLAKVKQLLRDHEQVPSDKAL